LPSFAPLVFTSLRLCEKKHFTPRRKVKTEDAKRWMVIRSKSGMKERSNNFNPRKLAVLALLALLLAAGSVATARAQDGDAPALTPEARRGGGGLLRALNLTPEQRAQIKAIRRETEPQGRLLGMRLQQARRALDEAIYADNPDERVIEERVRELGAAQAAVVRLRTFTELKIRRVLSAEQLDAFRRLQRRPRRRQQRMEQNSPQGDFPGSVNAAPAPLGNARQRRRTPLRELRPLRP
jgi:Spy/CpxP family protein refolding chaperone